jgi:hypothetical protein
MAFAAGTNIVLKGLGAFAVMLLPATMLFGFAALPLVAPAILVAFALAAPALAALHAAKRGALLRYHLLIGSLVGVLMLFILTWLIAGVEPGSFSLSRMDWLAFFLFACPAAAFGAWSGFAWWSFFEGGETLRKLLSYENLTKPPPNDW